MSREVTSLGVAPSHPLIRRRCWVAPAAYGRRHSGRLSGRLDRIAERDHESARAHGELGKVVPRRRPRPTRLPERQFDQRIWVPTTNQDDDGGPGDARWSNSSASRFINSPLCQRSAVGVLLVLAHHANRSEAHRLVAADGSHIVGRRIDDDAVMVAIGVPRRKGICVWPAYPG